MKRKKKPQPERKPDGKLMENFVAIYLLLWGLIILSALYNAYTGNRG